MKTFEDLQYKTIAISRKEIDRADFDSEDDFKDLLAKKLKEDDFEEIMSGWDIYDRNYVVIVKICP